MGETLFSARKTLIFYNQSPLSAQNLDFIPYVRGIPKILAHFFGFLWGKTLFLLENLDIFAFSLGQPSQIQQKISDFLWAKPFFSQKSRFSIAKTPFRGKRSLHHM